MYLQEAIDSFLAKTKAEKTTSTYETYSQALRQFLKRLRESYGINAETTTVEDLDTHKLKLYVTDFIGYLQTQSSESTERTYSQVVLRFYDEAADQQWLNVNIADIKKTAYSLRRKIIFPEGILSLEFIDAILHSIEQINVPETGKKQANRNELALLRDKALIFLLSDIGLQVHEALSLRLDDINLDEEKIRLRSENHNLQLSQFPNPRRFTQGLAQYIDKRPYLDKRQTTVDYGNLPVFMRHDKRASSNILPISRWTVGNIVKLRTEEATKQVGSKFGDQGHVLTPQTLRNYFIGNAYRVTGDLRATQLLARHSDPNATLKIINQFFSPEEIDDFSIVTSKDGVYFAGQYFDAVQHIRKLIGKAKQSILIVDNYVNEDVLDLLTGKQHNVDICILTKSVSPALRVAAKSFTKQYGPLEIRTSNAYHDRYFVLDSQEFYHLGASIKDLGHRGFRMSLVEGHYKSLLRKNLDEEWNQASTISL